MTEFTAKSVLDVVVSDRSLRSARDRIEQEIGGVTVDVDSTRSGPAVKDSGVSAVDLMSDQLAVLEDIHDEIEKLGQGGFGGGGGSGFAGGVGGGAGGGAGAGALGGAGLGTAALAGGAVGTVGAGIAGSRFALGEGLFGQAGKDTIAGRKQFEGLSGVQNAASNPLGALGSGAVNAVDPTGLIETGARSAAGSVQSAAPTTASNISNTTSAITSGDLEQIRNVEINQPSWLDGLGDSITEPPWLSTLTSGEIGDPPWLSTLTSGDIGDPPWLSTFADADIGDPPWLSTLTSGNLDKPDWVQSLETTLQPENISSNIENIGVNLGGFNFDLSASELESQIQTEIDNAIPDIVDQAVAEVQSQLSSL